MDTQLKIKRAGINEFDAIYKLLEESFPPDERRAKEEMRKLMLDGSCDIYYTGSDELPDAFMVVWPLEGLRFAEYFAVQPCLRGRGLGARMLKAVCALQPVSLCLEVEGAENGDYAARRIEFYRRGGFLLNDYTYYQPAYSPQQSAVELKLMTWPAALSMAEFKKVRGLIYSSVYKGKITAWEADDEA